MTDIPIIFSASMVLALLREAQEPGTGKTMTRRLAWTGKKAADGEGFRPSPWQKVKAGDRLWVRESGWWSIGTEVAPTPGRKCGMTCYRAEHNVDHSPAKDGKWRPSIHMPRWASRLTLIVTSTKIERLQDITEADARAEGVMPHVRGGWHWHKHIPSDVDDWHQFGFKTRAYAFQDLWERLHGEESWKANPWVVCLAFRVILANIDGEKAAA